MRGSRKKCPYFWSFCAKMANFRQFWTNGKKTVKIIKQRVLETFALNFWTLLLHIKFQKMSCFWEKVWRAYVRTTLFSFYKNNFIRTPGWEFSQNGRQIKKNLRTTWGSKSWDLLCKNSQWGLPMKC